MKTASEPAGTSLTKLRQAMSQRQANSNIDSPAQISSIQHAGSVDFKSLSEWEEIHLQRNAAQSFGIINPFFKTIRTAGAVASISGRKVINFGSYDYLGLGCDPRVREAAANAALEFGISAGASRLVGGERPWHHSLEDRLASFLGAQSAIAMVSGHATNMAIISTLLGPKDLILVDSLIHNSITEGARLSGATRLSFPHNDWQWVDDRLAAIRGRYRRVIIATEGLFSMDGDVPDLAAFIEVKNRHAAWLLLDEAHSIGTLGDTGRGLTEHQGINPQSVDIRMGTLSKSLASCGGFVVGSSALIDILRHKAASFVFSVGLAAPIAAAAHRALEILQSETTQIKRLSRNSQLMQKLARKAGLNIGLSEGHAILPIIAGDSLRAVRWSNEAFEHGIHCLPIIHPAVPEKQARLRLFLSANHEPQQLSDTVSILKGITDKF